MRKILTLDRSCVRPAVVILAALLAFLPCLPARAEPQVVGGGHVARPGHPVAMRPFLAVADGAGASIRMFSVGPDGALQPVPSSPFAAQPGVETVRFCGEQTLVASAQSPSQIGAPSTLQVFHVSETGVLIPAGGVVPIPKSARPWASVHPGARKFLFVPTAGLPDDRLYGFELVGRGPGTSLDPLPWSPQPLAGLMLFGGAAATPDGRFLYQVGYSNSMSGYAVSPDGSLAAFDVHGAAVGQLTNALVSPDGRHLYCTRDANPDQVAGFAIGPAGGLTALPGSPYPLPGESNFPGHIAITPNGRFVVVGSDGDLVTVLSRSASGALGSVAVATLHFSQTPGAVVCDDEHLFVIGEDALGVMHVFVYRFANLPGDPVQAAIVPAGARDLALSRAGT